ncbi:DUF6458 family protein [Ruania zhangjianzhongii]|nr:DUF6458 family protein [Ruania zhangjianzhongii]
MVVAMGVGGGIFLIVVGAILSFAVRDSWDVVDLTMVGYICMGAGALTVILALVINAQRARTHHINTVEHRPPPETGDPRDRGY